MTSPDLPPDAPAAGRLLDAGLHLLDRQVHDVDGVPIATVDDLEIEGVEPDAEIPPDAPPPVIGSLLSGPVLGSRVFGGRPPSERFHRTSWAHIVDVGTVVRLGVPGERLAVTWTERWVRDHVIGRIPGGRHDPE